MSPYSYAFTADFTQPDPITGLALDADDEAIAIAAAWDASGDAFHEEYLVEAQTGDDEWAEVGRTTDEAFVYYFSPLNVDVRIRVSDSNGSQYSDPTEDSATLDFPHWALTHITGGLIQALENDLPGTKVDLPLDQRSTQPLSGPSGDDQFPIVYTGQWQGERITATFYVKSEDSGVMAALKRAARMPQGEVALKDPDGGVYVVAMGGISLTDAGGGDRQVSITATRIA